MEDATGKEVSHAVEWEARELNGITVDGSMISFSEQAPIMSVLFVMKCIPIG